MKIDKKNYKKKYLKYKEKYLNEKISQNKKSIEELIKNVNDSYNNINNSFISVETLDQQAKKILKNSDDIYQSISSLYKYKNKNINFTVTLLKNINTYITFIDQYQTYNTYITDIIQSINLKKNTTANYNIIYQLRNIQAHIFLTSDLIISFFDFIVLNTKIIKKDIKINKENIKRTTYSNPPVDIMTKLVNLSCNLLKMLQIYYKQLYKQKKGIMYEDPNYKKIIYFYLLLKKLLILITYKLSF